MSQAAATSTPPQAQTQGDVVYGSTVEALFLKALGSKMTEKAHEAARAAGINLKQRLEPVYPRETYYAVVRAVARELYPTMTEDQQMFEMGTSFMKGFEETLVGRAILTGVRIMGPRRTLAKMTNNFRSSNNYMQTETKEFGPTDVELVLSQVTGAPAYFEGVVRAGLTAAGGKNISLERSAYDGTKCTYRIRWS